MAVVINPYTIPSFFAGILSLSLGLYAFYKNPKERATQVFFIMMLGCALWSLTPIAIEASASAEDATFWAKISNTGLLLIPVSLFHFTFLYHRKKAIEFYKIEMHKFDCFFSREFTILPIFHVKGIHILRKILRWTEKH